VKLLKLVWDFVAPEFGGRQLQYEMFYSAAQPVVNHADVPVLRLGAAGAPRAFVEVCRRCLEEY
jgi:aromatic ring hydroxylase